MIPPKLSDFDFKDKRILVRCDLDASLVRVRDRVRVENDTRLRECLPTVKYLLEHQAKEIILMGHLGRPEGKVVEGLKLFPVAEKFKQLFNFKFSILNFQLGGFSSYKINGNVILLENLRFDKREEENDEGFTKELAALGDFYVNEAFAASHREHASIVGIPKFLPHCAGLHFASEVEILSKVLENPKKPLIFIIGGAKPETKLAYIGDFSRTADCVLVGGTLVQNAKFKNIFYADLIENGLDINEDSIEKFCDIIRTAGTVVWNGPMGKYEDEKFATGTKKIGEMIAESKGFKVVGGGDTIAALKKFGLLDKMDYVSTGGGAMLEFLAKGTLLGIEALLENKN